MASQIDVSALTLNPEEAQEVGAAIIEKEFVNGVLSEDHAVETGVEHKKQIVFGGKIEDSLKKSTGCTPNAGSGMAFTEKFWDPEIFDSRWTHCAADLTKLLKLFMKAKRINPDFYDKIGSQEMGMITALIGMMLRETLPVKAWFSDKAADLHSGAGVFSTGTDLDLYNVIDGLFKQIFAEWTTGKVTITENAGVNYAAQALATDASFGYFEAGLQNADERLIADPDAKIICTRSMAENYLSTLRNKNLSNGFLEVTENGRAKLMFDGVPIKVRYDWDRTIKAHQDNGTKWNLPHRFVISTPDNMPVGTLAESDFETLDSWYEKKDKANITDVALSLDAKVLESYMGIAGF